MSKKGLGKGLGALIPEVDIGDRDSIQEIDVDRIVPNPRQPRKHFDVEKLQELAQSIREHGLVQPLVVRPRAEGFELVAGERRWRAAQLAALARVPTIVRDFTDAKMMEIALIENLQREDLNPLEEAEAYRVLLEEYNLTQEDLARRLGKSRPQITNTLRLLALEPALQQELAQGRLNVGHAKVLLGVEDAAKQRTLGLRAVKDGLSVRQLEAALQQEKEESSNRVHRGRPPVPPGLATVEDTLRQHLGAPVKITEGTPRGRIEIHFFGEADLTRLVDIILGQAEAPPARALRGFHV